MSIHLLGGSFRYSKNRPVFENLDLTITAGKTVLLGPNGAGKSTLMNALASVFKLQSGTLQLDELDRQINPRKNLKAFRKRVGWLPQNFSPFPGLTVAEHVAYSGWLKGMKASAARDKTAQALAQVDLESLADSPASKLSGGQTRRLGIAGTLVHQSSVMLLDEPTAGLDPGQRTKFSELLQKIDPKTCVLVSTHQTEDIHDSYDTVIVLDNGEIVFQGAMMQFIEGTPTDLDRRDRVNLAYARYVRQEA